MGFQIFAGGAGRLDRAGGRNVVCGDGIAEQRQHASVIDRLNRFRRFCHALEIGWVRHIGGGGPAIGLAVAGVDGAPFIIAFEHVRIPGREHLARHMLAHHFGDFLVRWPDVFQENVFPVFVFAERFSRQVHMHGAGQRISDHQRRRG